MKLKLNVKHILVTTMIFIILIALYKQYKKCNCTKCSKHEKHTSCKNMVFYGRDSCPYCLKMKKQMKQDGTFEQCKFVDTSKPAGNSEFKKVCEQKQHKGGVPYFVNECNGKSAVGYMAKSDLFQKLGL